MALARLVPQAYAPAVSKAMARADAAATAMPAVFAVLRCICLQAHEYSHCSINDVRQNLATPHAFHSC